MHNMLEHEDEIKARPARTWFQVRLWECLDRCKGRLLITTQLSTLKSHCCNS